MQIIINLKKNMISNKQNRIPYFLILLLLSIFKGKAIKPQNTKTRPIQ